MFYNLKPPCYTLLHYQNSHSILTSLVFGSWSLIKLHNIYIFLIFLCVCLWTCLCEVRWCCCQGDVFWSLLPERGCWGQWNPVVNAGSYLATRSAVWIPESERVNPFFSWNTVVWKSTLIHLPGLRIQLLRF